MSSWLCSRSCSLKCHLTITTIWSEASSALLFSLIVLFPTLWANLFSLLKVFFLERRSREGRRKGERVRGEWRSHNIFLHWLQLKKAKKKKGTLGDCHVIEHHICLCFSWIFFFLFSVCELDFFFVLFCSIALASECTRE